MKQYRRITSKNGVKMVVAQDANGYAVFTLEEWKAGEGYRYPEYDGITDEKEAMSQAKNYGGVEKEEAGFIRRCGLLMQRG